LKATPFFPSRHVPNADKSIQATRSQNPFRRRKRQGNDRSRMVREPVNDLSRGRFPDDDSLVVSSRGQQLAFDRRAEAAHAPIVSFQLALLLASGNIPKPYHTIGAS